MPGLAKEHLDRLWIAFKEQGDSTAREEIIGNYAHLVKITAGRVVSSMPNGLDREDLYSAGAFGLIKAVDQFDPGRDVKFETYAIALIRGAILEMLRGEDWVPRSIREKLKLLDRTLIELEGKLGRAPTETEIAESMGVTEDELSIIIQQASRTGVLSLDDVMASVDGEEHIHFIDLIVDENSNPEQETEGREVRRILCEGVDKLPERERLVVALYYYEGLTFREIGQVLGVSESRVYQLHTQAMTRVKAHIHAQGGIYAAF
ncbi:MAG: RNA polymerase sigma-D factor [Fimbriimonadales bacterium]|nr:MAG: FliA/WhiG family RNA polymerase sigma factor [Armatimonadota bacterium]MBV6503881.1 RNA polymerase sigma-D factor [Fimbriimonadales bacterium]MCE7899579.1 FliA/WhiG family RNA polymerase sigma factor [Armatimonadetes bacterium ATM1]MDL1927667.1 FliA/WhiG family RNA polymerase sigma factor [Fimbriimonadia bacterium ATM]MBC6970633.1 FliA/WhiG family RNA polymerase sigma factor [Armatimonadota bacterium]